MLSLAMGIAPEKMVAPLPVAVPSTDIYFFAFVSCGSIRTTMKLQLNTTLSVRTAHGNTLIYMIFMIYERESEFPRGKRFPNKGSVLPVMILMRPFPLHADGSVPHILPSAARGPRRKPPSRTPPWSPAERGARD